MRDRVFTFFVLGLLVRLLLAPYTHHAALWERVLNSEYLFIYGVNPLAHNPGFGTSLLVFYLPMHTIYLLLSSIGIAYPFILIFLYKIPPIMGDILMFYALHTISLHFSKDSAKSANIAAIYFLNPFVIWQGSAMGHTESLTAGFMLLALSYVLDDKVHKSAVSLSVATFFRYLPILIGPSLIIYLWRRDKSLSKGVKKFLKVFFISTALLSVGHILVVLQLYLSGPSSLLTLVDVQWSNLASGGIPGIIGGLPGGYFRNFTSFLAEVGLWPIAGAFISTNTFFVLYSLIVLIAFRRNSFSFRSVTQFITIVFCLFFILRSLYESHYLMWAFPFLILEASLFFSIPSYYPHILWFSSLLIDAIIGGQIVLGYYWTFPSFPRWSWPSSSVHPYLAMSLLHGLCLLAVVLKLSIQLLPRMKRTIGEDIIPPLRPSWTDSKIIAPRAVRRRLRFLLLGTLLLLLSYVPIGQAVLGGYPAYRVPPPYYFGMAGRLSSSYGRVESIEGKIVVGSAGGVEPSGAQWEVNLWLYPLLSAQAKNVSRAFVTIWVSNLTTGLSLAGEEASNIRFYLNGQKIFEESVVSMKKIYRSPIPQAKQMSVYFDLVGLTNLIGVAVGPLVSCSVSSISLNVEVSNEITPFWHTFQPFLIPFVGLVLVVAAVLLRKGHEWLSSI